MNIWQFNETVTRRLLAWNAANIAAGLALARREGVMRGIAGQAIGWGAINTGIALGGMFFTQRRKQSIPDPYDQAVMAKERRSLLRLLWINAGLDILYMMGGGRLAQTRGKSNRMMRGTGYGIVIQGALLFVFDIVHAILLGKHHEA